MYSHRMPAVLPGLLLQPRCRCVGTLSSGAHPSHALSTVKGGGGGMHGRRTALGGSPSTPSPAGGRPRGRSIVLPFGSGVARSIAAWRAGGGAWGGEACSWV